MTSSPTIRVGVDIGGTFTDVALEIGERRFTGKILTTPHAPEDGVLAALRSVTAEAGVEPGEVGGGRGLEHSGDDPDEEKIGCSPATHHAFGSSAFG